MTKTAKIIVVIVAILLIAGLFVHFKVSNKALSTYENKELGFKFSYPSIFKENKRANKDLYYAILEQDNVALHPGTMSILDDAFAVAKKQNTIDYTNTKIIKIGNNEYYYKYDEFSFEGYQVHFYYYPTDQSVGYFFVAWSSQRDFDAENHPADKNARKILETLEFTNIVSAEKSDWKTYTNEKYGFEFQYPSNWVKEEYMSDLGGFYYIALGKFPNAIKSEPLITLKIYPDQGSIESFLKYFGYPEVPWTNIKIGDIAAKERIVSIPNQHKILNMAFIENSSGYDLSSAIYADSVDIVKKIGSTFKFTK